MDIYVVLKIEEVAVGDAEIEAEPNRRVRSYTATVMKNILNPGHRDIDVLCQAISRNAEGV